MNEICKDIHLVAAKFSEEYGSNSQLEAIKRLSRYTKTGNVIEQKKWIQVAEILSDKSFSKDAFGPLN